MKTSGIYPGLTHRDSQKEIKKSKKTSAAPEKM